eukprot:scaffold49900_cov63-Phaeocystis_antarctica.AAC.2
MGGRDPRWVEAAGLPHWRSEEPIRSLMPSSGTRSARSRALYSAMRATLKAPCATICMGGPARMARVHCRCTARTLPHAACTRNADAHATCTHAHMHARRTHTARTQARTLDGHRCGGGVELERERRGRAEHVDRDLQRLVPLVRVAHHQDGRERLFGVVLGRRLRSRLDDGGVGDGSVRGARLAGDAKRVDRRVRLGVVRVVYRVLEAVGRRHLLDLLGRVAHEEHSLVDQAGDELRLPRRVREDHALRRGQLDVAAAPAARRQHLLLEVRAVHLLRQAATTVGDKHVGDLGLRRLPQGAKPGLGPLPAILKDAVDVERDSGAAVARARHFLRRRRLSRVERAPLSLAGVSADGLRFLPSG